jgi:hypothetical protein
MAATGLLGFNPYGKAPVIDILSKPTQYAVQLQQKEEAKKEALDKYFMDYEKSINPAGMRKAESDIFLNKLAENKAFYLQNRDKILNPAKYGYDAQSQYMSNFKGMLGLINQSKQAAAQDKLTTQHFIAQKDLNAPDGYAEAVEASHLPVTDTKYKPLDLTQFKFYKTFNPFDNQKELKSLNTIPGEPELITKDLKGNPLPQHMQYQRTPMEADINNIKSFSYNKLGDTGYVKMLQHLSDNEVNQLKDVYKKRLNGAELPINDIKEVSLAYNLANLPKDYTQTRLAVQPAYAAAQQDAYIRTRAKEKANDPIKFFQDGVTALKTGNVDVINNHFNAWKSQMKFGTRGETIGFDNMEVLPDGKIKVNYGLPLTIRTKSGVSVLTKNPQSMILDPNDPSLLPKITSLDQLFLGSNKKAEDATKTTPTPVVPKPPKSPIVWKPNK